MDNWKNTLLGIAIHLLSREIISGLVLPFLKMQNSDSKYE